MRTRRLALRFDAIGWAVCFAMLACGGSYAGDSGRPRAVSDGALPPRTIEPQQDERGIDPSVDLTIGDLTSMQQMGRVGDPGLGQVGLSAGTVVCNLGGGPSAWFPFPSSGHPAVALNLYRLRSVGGAERFEQIGQSWARHGFCPLEQSQCATCVPAGGCGTSLLGPGCSTSDSAGANGDQNQLGARSWINPFTGAFSSGANNHSGHTHDGVSHRLLVSDTDLVGVADYFVEARVVAPDDAASGHGDNNASYRRVLVSGPNGSGDFSFATSGATQVESPALEAWIGATQVPFFPDANDGWAVLAYQVTGLGNSDWRYEFALCNMNYSRAFYRFRVPVPAGVQIRNVGFHYPLNHGPQSTGADFENADWSVTLAGGGLIWTTETKATNPNANACRWGTLFNFRFDANTPPQAATVNVGVFDGGADAPLSAVGPSPSPCPADLDNSGQIDLNDLSILLVNFGQFGGAAEGDLNGDGLVDLLDLSTLLAAFGTSC